MIMLGKGISWVIGKTWKLLEWFRARIAWVLLRLLDLEYSLEEVEKRSQLLPPGKNDPQLPSGAPIGSEGALEEVKAIYEGENDRRSTVDDKAKSLLTATSVLFTLSAALLNSSTLARTASAWLIVSLAVLWLFATLFLLVAVYFGINRRDEPDLSESVLKGIQAGDYKALVLEYFGAANYNHRVHSFLVDTYRAARRAFLIALLCLGAGALTAAFHVRSGEDRVVEMLRSDPALIKLLQGPKGDQGPSGRDGLPGPEGPVGVSSVYLPSVIDLKNPDVFAPRPLWEARSFVERQ